MNTEERQALEARRDALRAQLQSQRQIIVQEFGGNGQRRTFPRSKTMNLLTRRPELIVRTVSGVAKLIRWL